MSEEIKRRYPTLTEWAKAEALWATGDVTLEELAKIVGVSPTSVSLHMKKAKITKGEKAEERRKAVSDKVAEEALGDISEHAQRIKETKEEHYKASQSIAKLTLRELAKAQQDHVPFGAITPNLKALEVAMNVLAKSQQSRWQILGLDRPDAVDDSELPALEITELTADQIEELRSRNFNDPLNFDDLELDDDEDGEQGTQSTQE